MALKKGDRTNFKILLAAAKVGSLCLMECKDAKTGDYRAVICAVNHVHDAYEFVPLGHMNTGNGYEDYTPPSEEEGASA